MMLFTFRTKHAKWVVAVYTLRLQYGVSISFAQVRQVLRVSGFIYTWHNSIISPSKLTIQDENLFCNNLKMQQFRWVGNAYEMCCF